jgi:hypothetical protein
MRLFWNSSNQLPFTILLLSGQDADSLLPGLPLSISPSGLLP